MAERGKFYFIMAESISELLKSVNATNSRAKNVYGKETNIDQVFELILSPGEFVAICHDVTLPPQQDHTYKPNYDPLVKWLKKRIEDLPPPQTVVADDEPGS